MSADYQFLPRGEINDKDAPLIRAICDLVRRRGVASFGRAGGCGCMDSADRVDELDNANVVTVERPDGQVEFLRFDRVWRLDAMNITRFADADGKLPIGALGLVVEKSDRQESGAYLRADGDSLLLSALRDGVVYGLPFARRCDPTFIVRMPVPIPKAYLPRDDSNEEISG